MQQNTFGERLTELRENKNLSRQKVADDLGISRASLEYYEKGKRTPDIEILLKLADYFGVTCDYLVKGVSTENVSIHNKTGLSDKSIEVLALLNQLKNKSIEHHEKILNYLKNQENVVQENGYLTDGKLKCELVDDRVHRIDIVNYFIEKIFTCFGDLKELEDIANLEYFNNEPFTDMEDEIMEKNPEVAEMIYKHGTVLVGEPYRQYLEQIVINNFRGWVTDFSYRFSPYEGEKHLNHEFFQCGETLKQSVEADCEFYEHCFEYAIKTFEDIAKAGEL